MAEGAKSGARRATAKRSAARTGRTSKTPETPATEGEAAEQQIDGVLVIRTVDKEGNLTTNVQVLGDVRITEAETLLKLGLKGFQKQIGVSE